MVVSQAKANKYTQALLSKPTSKPAQKQPSFLDNLVSGVKQLFNPSPQYNILPTSTVAKMFQSQPISINQQLDRIQSALNPYINQANKNASMIHNYLVSQRPVSSGGTYIPGPMMGPPSALEAYSANGENYNVPVDTGADYLPVIQNLTDMIRQKHIGNPAQSVDLSPYLTQAENIRQQREAMG